MEMRSLGLKKTQRRLWRLAQLGEASTVEGSACHHIRHRGAQNTAAVGQHPQGIIKPIQLVVSIAKRGRTQVGGHRTAPVSLFCPGKNDGAQALGLPRITAIEAGHGPRILEDHGHVIVAVIGIDRLLGEQRAERPDPTDRKVSPGQGRQADVAQ
ncbi:hypothetical protein D3C79_742000 [compost metagenome]